MGRALIFFAWVFALMLALASGCCGPVRGLYPPPDPAHAIDIYIYNNHWHSGFVLDRAALSPILQKVLQRFDGAKFVEIGWGDEGFYRANHATSGMAIQALFFSRGSVLHVAAFDENPEDHYREFAVELYRIEISEAGHQCLMKYLGDTFATNPAGDSIALQPGLYGVSSFFAARGHYSAFHTCNDWTAAGLRATGFPISPFYAQMANNVGWQIRTFGARYQSDLLVVNQ